MPWLFSFGSNNPQQLSDRLGWQVEGIGAYAPGYVRAFRGMSRNWGGGTATMLKKKGGVVYGYAVKVDAEDLDQLDRYEGVPRNYRRANVKIKTQDGRDLKAVAYLSNRREKNPPSRAYKQAVAETIGQFWRGSGGRVTEHDIVVRNPSSGKVNWLEEKAQLRYRPPSRTARSLWRDATRRPQPHPRWALEEAVGLDCEEADGCEESKKELDSLHEPSRQAHAPAGPDALDPGQVRGHRPGSLRSWR